MKWAPPPLDQRHRAAAPGQLQRDKAAVGNPRHPHLTQLARFDQGNQCIDLGIQGQWPRRVGVAKAKQVRSDHMVLLDQLAHAASPVQKAIAAKAVDQQ